MIDEPLINKAIKHADNLNAATHFLIQKSMNAYNLKNPPTFLPNPCRLPERELKKSSDPLVCFLARLDPVKRPEIFFRLAKDFPNIQFVVMGQSTNPSDHEKLIKNYKNIPNLKFLGWTFGEQKSNILEKAWILINTSIHEGLPNSFLEAWAHQCAILSSTNPDNLVNSYGYSLNRSGENFATGLKKLIENDLWKEKGKKGQNYVKETHDFNIILDQHLQIYKS